MDREMQMALETDGEKLRQLTGEDHGPWSLEAPSPFLPGTKLQFAWDSTALGWLKTCPRLYQYHMIEGWVGKGEAVHLEFGIHYHKALETYDRLMAEHNFSVEVHEFILKDVIWELLKDTWIDGKPWRNSATLDPSDKASLKCRENLVRTVVWYLDQFRDDPAKTKVSEGRPLVELSFRFDLDFWPHASPWKVGERPQEDPNNFWPQIDRPQSYMLCGHLDRVVIFQDHAFGMDRKTTTSTLGSYYFEQYEPDNQISLYTVACQVAFATPVKGFIIDAAQVAVGFSRFVRHFVYKTPDQIDEWMKDLRYWLRQNETFVTEDYWPMNDKSCHKYGGCIFRGVCSKSPSVRQRFLEADFVRRPWNPLEVR